MKRYRVLVNGENVLMKFCGREGRYGFYAMRYIVAGSLEEAEESALDALRQDPELNREILNGKEGPPRFFIFGAEEAPAVEGETPARAEISFYPEEGGEDPRCRARGGCACRVPVGSTPGRRGRSNPGPELRERGNNDREGDR